MSCGGNADALIGSGSRAAVEAELAREPHMVLRTTVPLDRLFVGLLTTITVCVRHTKHGLATSIALLRGLDEQRKCTGVIFVHHCLHLAVIVRIC